MSDCIEHKQKQNRYGISRIVIDGKWVNCGVHVLAYYKRYGFLPTVVMHSCDNKRCINPDHLVGGTHKANSLDAFNKGIRSNHYQRKLSPEQVADIRKHYESQKDSAKRHNVSQDTVWKIRKHLTYTDI